MSGNRKHRRGNYLKQRRRKFPVWIAAILAVAALAAAALWLWAGSGDRQASEPGQDSQAAGTSEATESSIPGTSAAETAGTLPQVAQSTGLTLSSVYTSSILNPDCRGEYAEEVASLEVTNSSGSYLVSATLTATMSDGTEVYFTVSDLPAGATAEIFDTENQSMASGVTCSALVCTSETYLDGDMLLSGTVEVTASGAAAVITNTGSGDLAGLTVVYHCDMAGQYFGGTSYTLTIDSLAAGESYTLSDGTLMGEVAVVRIYQ